MSDLDLYHKKRNFSKTTEPQEIDLCSCDDDNHNGDCLPIFVIQEHHASSLHYDLRLEIDGVLKSWAVPKGISMTVNEKRLAVQTEDHPLAYKDFFGIIPHGEYGAGEVIIWDKGNYVNVRSNDNMLNSWNNGKITIKFDGNKIQGTYTLLKTINNKFQSNKKSITWLLFKNKT